MNLSPAFAGCSEAYVRVHLSNARCIDGRPHDGGPCLLNDATRSDEALRLLSAVPVHRPGDGVQVDEFGQPYVAGEIRHAS